MSLTVQCYMYSLLYERKGLLFVFENNPLLHIVEILCLLEVTKSSCGYCTPDRCTLSSTTCCDGQCAAGCTSTVRGSKLKSCYVSIDI